MVVTEVRMVVRTVDESAYAGTNVPDTLERESMGSRKVQAFRDWTNGT